MHAVRVLGKSLSCTLAAVCLAAGAAGNAQPAPEYEVKAAILYKLTRFIEWPAGAPASTNRFVVGVIGEDPFGAVLREAFENKTVGDRQVEIRRVHSRDAEKCDLLFIAPSEQRRLPAILAAVGKHPVITVGDMPGFAQRGGIIGLVTSGGTISLEVNLRAAESAHIRISSHVLRLARIVGGQ